jgi:hypothetical protein
MSSKVVEIKILDDHVFEGSENFSFVLSNPVNATIGDGVGVGTITDSEDAPRTTTGMN